jgi:hypothetical protein
MADEEADAVYFLKTLAAPLSSLLSILLLRLRPA